MVIIVSIIVSSWQSLCEMFPYIKRIKKFRNNVSWEGVCFVFAEINIILTHTCFVRSCSLMRQTLKKWQTPWWMHCLREFVISNLHISAARWTRLFLFDPRSSAFSMVTMFTIQFQHSLPICNSLHTHTANLLGCVFILIAHVKRIRVF